uniref:M23 family metallopeptidase n=1 Tax=candidate division WOR-3 bacterium TaxID=2052148 RepID=A0A7V3ZUS3_UNCW3
MIKILFFFLITNNIYVVKKNDIPSQILEKKIANKEVREKVLKFFSFFNLTKNMNIGDTFLFSDSLIIYKKDILKTYYFYIKENYVNLAMPFYFLLKNKRVIKGKIGNSLYESMLSLKEKPKLVSMFAEILEWDIDFFTECYKGDSWFCYLEKICLVNIDNETIPYDYEKIFAVRYQGKMGNFYGFYYKDCFYDFKGQSLKRGFLRSPLRYSYISSFFSFARFHPILKILRPHLGVDYAAPYGTPVSAVGDGYVSYAGYKGDYGKLIEITHPNGYKTRYGHLSKFGKNIKKGKRVKQGEIIGYVGQTGLATGPHLHFEVLKFGKHINPFTIKTARYKILSSAEMKEFQIMRDSLISILK